MQCALKYSYNLIFVKKKASGACERKGYLQVRTVTLIEDLKQGYLISKECEEIWILSYLVGRQHRT